MYRSDVVISAVPDRRHVPDTQCVIFTPREFHFFPVSKTQHRQLTNESVLCDDRRSFPTSQVYLQRRSAESTVTTTVSREIGPLLIYAKKAYHYSIKVLWNDTKMHFSSHSLTFIKFTQVYIIKVWNNLPFLLQ